MSKKMSYDYIEYYVGEAKMVAFWHVQAMGFNVVAYCGPESGVTDKVSYLLQKNDLRIIITSSIHNPEIDAFVNLHGSGIKTIGIKVKNIAACKDHLIKQEAIILSSYQQKDEAGVVSSIDVKLFDSNVLSFSDYSDYEGDFFPHFIPFTANWGVAAFDNLLFSIDHIAYALRRNEIKIWEDYLNRIFSSFTIFEFNPETGLDMHLKVLGTPEKAINNVIVEPVELDGKSQINNFINNNRGNGIQHIAFRSQNIFETVGALRKRGIEFIGYPEQYYTTLQEKNPNLDITPLKAQGVLCEKEKNKMLLQIFTKPIGDNQTYFYEIIQRHNEHRGFGLGNITALFEAVEMSYK